MDKKRLLKAAGLALTLSVFVGAAYLLAPKVKDWKEKRKIKKQNK